MKKKADLRQFSDHFDYKEVRRGVYSVIGSKVPVIFFSCGKWIVGEKKGIWGLPLRKYLEKHNLHDSLKPIEYPHYLSRQEMYFGKYKGMMLTELPSSYLRWLEKEGEGCISQLAKSVLKHRSLLGDMDDEYCDTTPATNDQKAS